MQPRKTVTRRTFTQGLAATGSALVLGRFGRARAAAPKLRVGVLLPNSGLQAQIGQSCQRGADLAPGILKQALGVEVELMNADTESNAETARARAERLVEQGAQVLVGAFDSGHTLAIAQVAEQRGVPLIVNIAAAPQITEQGYKFVFRAFPAAPELVRNGLQLVGEVLKTAPGPSRSAVFMHVNDTFGQSIAKGVAATLPQLNLPFTIASTIAYDPAAKDLSVEVSKAKAVKADFLLLACRLNDAIVLRREMVKQRWSPMGIISPGSPGLYEEQYTKALGKYAQYAISNTAWFNPKSEMTKRVAAAFKQRYPHDELAFHGLNVGYTFDAVMIAADACKRAGSSDPKALVEALRKTDIAPEQRMSLGSAIRFDEKGQAKGGRSAVIQNLNGKPTVVLPSDLAEGHLVFPSPEYSKV